ncbi:glyceraldehyde-3-phosphate dehydrogenase GAPCP2, chloroplastic-like [Miscanthus floridulus]|uniref:glyceraldehyde-3-phosphate dehydrogenase GAPCP2, chloroplastic-like n=1 Tax=Miscanthus floridulus TaxID=154761 RepID=UPI00345AC095
MAALSIPLRAAAVAAGSRTAAADPVKVSCVRSTGSAHFGCAFPSITASSAARNIEPLRAIATQAPPAVPQYSSGEKTKIGINGEFFYVQL